MILETNHAEVPSCKECTAWFFDKDWKPVRIPGTNRPMPRGGAATPCWKCPKGPKPFENEPTRKTLAAIDYYYLCLADDSGFLVPRDRRVVENNAVIARVREQTLTNKLDLLPLLAVANRGKTP